jgi:hypothetical protein
MNIAYRDLNSSGSRPVPDCGQPCDPTTEEEGQCGAGNLGNSYHGLVGHDGSEHRLVTGANTMSLE